LLQLKLVEVNTMSDKKSKTISISKKPISPRGNHSHNTNNSSAEQSEKTVKDGSIGEAKKTPSKERNGAANVTNATALPGSASGSPTKLRATPLRAAMLSSQEKQLTGQPLNRKGRSASCARELPKVQMPNKANNLRRGVMMIRSDSSAGEGANNTPTLAGNNTPTLAGGASSPHPFAVPRPYSTGSTWSEACESGASASALLIGEMDGTSLLEHVDLSRPLPSKKRGYRSLSVPAMLPSHSSQSKDWEQEDVFDLTETQMLLNIEEDTEAIGLVNELKHEKRMNSDAMGGGGKRARRKKKKEKIEKSLEKGTEKEKERAAPKAEKSSEKSSEKSEKSGSTKEGEKSEKAHRSNRRNRGSGSDTVEKPKNDEKPKEKAERKEKEKGHRGDSVPTVILDATASNPKASKMPKQDSNEKGSASYGSNANGSNNNKPKLIPRLKPLAVGSLTITGLDGDDEGQVPLHVQHSPKSPPPAPSSASSLTNASQSSDLLGLRSPKGPRSDAPSSASPDSAMNPSSSSPNLSIATGAATADALVSRGGSPHVHGKRKGMRKIRTTTDKTTTREDEDDGEREKEEEQMHTLAGDSAQLMSNERKKLPQTPDKVRAKESVTVSLGSSGSSRDEGSSPPLPRALPSVFIAAGDAVTAQTSQPKVLPSVKPKEARKEEHVASKRLTDDEGMDEDGTMRLLVIRLFVCL
jgi:hypothetical protein